MISINVFQAKITHVRQKLKSKTSCTQLSLNLDRYFSNLQYLALWSRTLNHLNLSNIISNHFKFTQLPSNSIEVTKHKMNLPFLTTDSFRNKTKLINTWDLVPTYKALITLENTSGQVMLQKMKEKHLIKLNTYFTLVFHTI